MLTGTPRNGNDLAGGPVITTAERQVGRWPGHEYRKAAEVVPRSSRSLR